MKKAPRHPLYLRRRKQETQPKGNQPRCHRQSQPNKLPNSHRHGNHWQGILPTKPPDWATSQTTLAITMMACRGCTSPKLGFMTWRLSGLSRRTRQRMVRICTPMSGITWLIASTQRENLLLHWRLYQFQ